MSREVINTIRSDFMYNSAGLNLSELLDLHVSLQWVDRQNKNRWEQKGVFLEGLKLIIMGLFLAFKRPL